MVKKLGMTMGRVFLGIRPALPLMGQSSILINGFRTGLGIFKKIRGKFEYCPVPPRLYIKLISFNFYFTIFNI